MSATGGTLPVKDREDYGEADLHVITDTTPFFISHCYVPVM
jgi:hypothetical protein